MTKYISYNKRQFRQIIRHIISLKSIFDFSTGPRLTNKYQSATINPSFSKSKTKDLQKYFK